MKKTFLIAIALLASSAAQAQFSLGIFNHLGVGVGVGTTGVNVDVAMPITRFVTVRGGVNVMPQIKVSSELDIETNSLSSISYGSQTYNIPSEIDIEGKPTMTTGKLLFDIYPFPVGSFFISAGAYFGGGSVVKAYNKEEGVLADVYRWNQSNPNEQIGAALGDYFLTPDSKGNVNAQIKVNSFRPYLGIGFGRAIPKHRLGFQMELGCQFWGSPKIYCNDTELEEDKVGDGDDGGAIKFISKISVYPTLTFRLTGRIF